MRFAYSERRSYFRKDRYPKEGNGLFCCLRFFFFVPWGGFGPAFLLILLGFFSSLDGLSIPIDAEKSSEAILSKGICIWSQNSWSTRSSMEKLYGESNLCYDKRASPALLSFRGEISMGKKTRQSQSDFARRPVSAQGWEVSVPHPDAESNPSCVQAHLLFQYGKIRDEPDELLRVANA